MSVKTEEHDEGQRRQMCASCYNIVQLCKGHLQVGNNFPLRYMLVGKQPILSRSYAVRISTVPAFYSGQIPHTLFFGSYHQSSCANLHEWDLQGYPDGQHSFGRIISKRQRLPQPRELPSRRPSRSQKRVFWRAPCDRNAP